LSLKPTPAWILSLSLLLPLNSSWAADDTVLERRVKQLEARVEKLERLLDEKFADDRWKDPVLWSRVRPGMSTTDVRKLLGKPTRIEQAIFTTWYYHKTSKLHSHVWFDEGKVLGWEGLDR
jgi:hypothetical protein